MIWSAIPGSYDDSHGGSLFLYKIASLASSKRRIWAVLMDRALLLYNSTNTMEPMESLVLKSCTVSKNEEGIITVTRPKAPAASFHLHNPAKQQENIWFKLLEEFW